MHTAMIGWSYHTTPVELRERLAFSQAQLEATLNNFKERFPGTESVLISTCNRVEIYFAATLADLLPTTNEVGSFIAESHGLEFGDIESKALQLQGEDTVKHLFTVASSLDSMVVGEVQIVAQVRAAYEEACRLAAASTNMHQIFQRATLVAKRVATETGIHKRRVSIPSIAVSEIATEFFERFDDKRTLLVGAGEMGTETLRYLIEKGASRITVVNRSRQNAENLAREFEAQTADWDQLYSQIGEADLIVSTTGADRPIMNQKEFAAARSRKGSSLLILDLAVPRDVDPAIGELSDVYLYTVDDLQQVCDRNIAARKKEWPKAQEIIAEETKKFLADRTHRGSGITIKQLRERTDELKSQELSRLHGKLEARGLYQDLNGNMGDEIKKELEKSFDRLANKILHPPMRSLRENADSSYHPVLVEALRKLFQLDE
ncbi:MAG: glutamyl-tRNA reductase [Planctomycetota bacterium]